MSTDGAEPPIHPKATPDRAALIHAVYRIALEPQTYDVFMDRWNDHVTRALDALSALQAKADVDDREIVGHFQTAFGILEELGRRPAERVHEGSGARLLIDRAGRIVWCNPMAEQKFELSGISGIEALEAHLTHPRTLRKLLSGLNHAPTRATADSCLLHFAGGRKDGYMLARHIRDRNGQLHILIEPLPGDWPPELDRLLLEAFDLTEAETRIAAGLAEGLDAASLAERRGVSVFTVRAQIRALLAKTGAATQRELVRLLISVARAFDRTNRDKPETAAPVVCVMPDGRAVPISLRGPTDGFPVIFFHGMLDGCSATAGIDAALHRAGLRLIAPVRPGFGSAPPVDGPPSKAAERFAADVEGMLDRLRLDRVALLGHMAGALYAFAAAARLTDRVVGIVNVAGTVPIVSNAQFSSMARRQRLVAYTARYAPAALPFVLRAGIRQLDFDGESEFMAALYANSPRDLETIADPEVFRALQRGYRFTVAQGHHAFVTYGSQVVRDWTELALASTAPVTLMHGRADPVVSAASVADFARRLGTRATLRILEDCGQLLLYRAPEKVCDALQAQIGTLAAPPGGCAQA